MAYLGKLLPIPLLCGLDPDRGRYRAMPYLSVLSEIRREFDWRRNCKPLVEIWRVSP